LFSLFARVPADAWLAGPMDGIPMATLTSYAFDAPMARKTTLAKLAKLAKLAMIYGVGHWLHLGLAWATFLWANGAARVLVCYPFVNK
jgi:hypothetical protein